MVAFLAHKIFSVKCQVMRVRKNKQKGYEITDLPQRKMACKIFF